MCVYLDIFSVVCWHDLDIWVMAHSRSLEMTSFDSSDMFSNRSLFDRSRTSFYSSSIVTMAVAHLVPFPKLSEILVEKRRFVIFLLFDLYNHIKPLRISFKNFNTRCWSP